MKFNQHFARGTVRAIMQCGLDKINEVRKRCPGIGGDVDAMNLRETIANDALMSTDDVTGICRQAGKFLFGTAKHVGVDANDVICALEVVGTLLIPKEKEPDKLRLRLVLDVGYIMEDDAAEKIETQESILRENLLNLVKRGMNQGLITQDTMALVDTHELKIERIHV